GPGLPSLRPARTASACLDARERRRDLRGGRHVPRQRLPATDLSRQPRRCPRDDRGVARGVPERPSGCAHRPARRPAARAGREAPTRPDRLRARGRAMTEVREGLRVDWDVPIEMDDGLVLRADVFRPLEEGAYPVILSYGPYAKGLHFEDGYPDQWRIMCTEHPDVPAGSSNIHANWEVVDPEKWVPHGYACVRVDSRGTGRSPGYVQHFSPRETKDFYDCIEWAGVQSWSNGKVGLSGISYYAMNQWQVASLQPPHLAAMCAWEGAADWYRDSTHHGGLLSTFWANWYEHQVETVQYGLGERGPRSRATGELVCGDETLSEEELAANRAD